MKGQNNPNIFLEFDESPSKAYENLIKCFYSKKILRSKYLKKYFKEKEIEKVLFNIGKYLFNILKEKNDNFHVNENLKNIHKNMGITNDDYDLYKGLFIIMMREMDYSEELTSYFSLGLEKIREHIVSPQKFTEIFPNTTQNLDQLLLQTTVKTQENFSLSSFFNKMTTENIKIHQKRIIHMIFGTIPFVTKENNIYALYHKKYEIIFSEFFEMKNILTNSILDIYNASFKHSKQFPITFPKEIDRIFSNIEKLRPLILVNPSRNIETRLDLQFLSETLSKKMLENKLMQKLFLPWQLSKVIKHSEIVLKYILKYSSNNYFECDLIPAHCKSEINSEQFNIMKEITKNLLTDFRISKEFVSRAIQDFQFVKNHICKEKTFFEKIGGSSFVSPCIDHIYVNLFGDSLTKHLFLNVDGDYVKYKQKIIFCKIFRNKISSNDFDDLKAIHSRLKISDTHFKIFVKYMKEYLINAEINNEDSASMLKEVTSLEPYIVTKK